MKSRGKADAPALRSPESHLTRLRRSSSRRIARLLIDLGEADLGDAPQADVEALAYAVKLRLTAARARAAGEISLGIAGPPAVVSALLANDLGPYVDFIVWNGPPASDRRGHEVWQRFAGAPDGRNRSRRHCSQLERPGVDRWLWPMPADAGVAAALVADLARAAALLPRGLVESSPVTIACGGVPAAAYLNPETLETVALARACPPDAALTVTPSAPGVERVTFATGDAIVRVPAAGAQDRFAEGVQVVGARELTVEEIVARHQAAAARQAAAVRDLISTGALTLSFEAPGFPAPLVISSEAVMYSSAGVTELEQRAVRVNGIEFRGGSVPRLPIIEPERVASPPLAITLTGVYRYRLAGRDRIGGTPCYVVAFDPIDRAAPLFRGRAWIAADSFAMVKVAAAQTGLRGPIVASEQVDEFREERQGIWLLARSDVRQMYEGAAHRTPIHRVLSMATHAINPPDFLARRQAAYASDAVMLRDTPQGYRYLRRERASGGAAVPPEPAVAGRASRVRTLAAGVIVDPNISVPLPFAGFSYVDFNLFGTGTQLNVFFGGTYGQLAFAVPSLGGSRWQLAGRAFGIASSYNDRSFVNGRERYDENVRQRPAQAAVWLLRPLTPRISMRIGYDLDYTHLAAGDATAPAFAVPADQIVHGARLALDAQRDGWNASVWWNPALRTGWRAWGFAGSGEYDPAHQRLSALRRVPRAVRGVVAAAGRPRRGILDVRPRSRSVQPVFVRHLRQPAARVSLGADPVRSRRRPAHRGGLGSRQPAARRRLFRHVAGARSGLRTRAAQLHRASAARSKRRPRSARSSRWSGATASAGINSDGSRGTQVIRVSGYKVF